MSLQNNKKKEKTSNFLYDFVKVTGAIPTLCWMRPKIRYISAEAKKQHKGGFLIASNHVSFTDPITVHHAFWYRRLDMIATKEIFDTDLKNWFFTRMHCIKIDRENLTIASIREVIDRLKEDKAVVIFPEGTVNRSEDELLDFKSGAILMAHLGGKPIVPIYIAKIDKWTNRRTIVIGEAINVNDLCGKIPTTDALNKAALVLRDKELQLKHYYESEIMKK